MIILQNVGNSPSKLKILYFSQSIQVLVVGFDFLIHCFLINLNLFMNRAPIWSSFLLIFAFPLLIIQFTLFTLPNSVLITSWFVCIFLVIQLYNSAVDCDCVAHFISTNWVVQFQFTNFLSLNQLVLHSSTFSQAK